MEGEARAVLALLFYQKLLSMFEFRLPQKEYHHRHRRRIICEQCLHTAVSQVAIFEILSALLSIFRYGGRPTLSNAHRAHESAVSADNIRDELDEVIVDILSCSLICEYRSSL